MARTQQPKDPSLTDVIGNAIKFAMQQEGGKPQDLGAARLAVEYAKQIESGGQIEKIGPALLNALEALHMTPRSRATGPKGKVTTSEPAPQPASKLDELRVRRAQRTG